jgi:hypothetical protein
MGKLSGVLRKAFPGIGSVSALIAAGALFGPLADGASRATQPEGFSFREASIGEAAASGVLTASLGGLRTLAADVFWLRAYVMWERRDRAACDTYARAACALAPETPYFRKEYANWLAFEFPHWTVRRLGGRSKVPQPEQDILHRRDANAALAWLDAEMHRTPTEPNYPLAAGQITRMKLKDHPRAAAYYRRAAETPEAPLTPALEYAHYLWNEGRGDEAAAWLRSYAARVPAGSRSQVYAQALLADITSKPGDK